MRPTPAPARRANLPAPLLLVPQRHHRIQPRRPQRRQQARRRSHQRQTRKRHRERSHIPRLQPEQHRRSCPPAHQCERRPNYQSSSIIRLNSARLSTGSFSTSRNIAFDDSDVRFSVSSPAGAVGFSCARFLSPGRGLEGAPANRSRRMPPRSIFKCEFSTSSPRTPSNHDSFPSGHSEPALVIPLPRPSSRNRRHLINVINASHPKSTGFSV